MTIQPSSRALTACSLAALFSSLGPIGCFHAGVAPRTGEVLPAGEIAGGATISLGTIAAGAFGAAEGNTGQRGPVSAGAIFSLYMHNIQGFMRIGVADRMELELSLGAQEGSFGARMGIWQEDDGDAASVALSAAAYYRPAWWSDTEVFRADGFGGRVGLDTSVRAGQTVAFVWNPAISFGPEAHAAGIPRDEPCHGFGGEGCGETGPGAYAYVMRHELRLHSGLGIALSFTPDKLPMQMTFGAVPYFVAWGSDPVLTYCLACTSTTEYASVREEWGVHIVARIDTGRVGPNSIQPEDWE